MRQVYGDGSGRLLVIEFVFHNELFRLINIYAPNIENERKVFKEMKPLCKGNYIVVGTLMCGAQDWMRQAARTLSRMYPENT